MTSEFLIVWRPSVKATAPASRRRPNSVISRPASPLVIAAAGKMLTTAVSRAVRSTNSTRATSSMTGCVSGIITSEVTPPAAAAMLAEAMVSRCSAPGSPMKTRVSTRPGMMVRPVQSTTVAPSGAPWLSASLPAAAIFVPWTTTVPISSMLREGSTMRAWENTVAFMPLPFIAARIEQGLHHRHAHGDAHFHLLLNDALGPVRDLGGDFNATVHRPRVHDQGIRLGELQLFCIQAKVAEVFAHRRHERAFHSLALQAKHHYHVRVLQPFCHRAMDGNAHLLDTRRKQGGRRHHTHLRAHRVEQDDVGARHARMQYVAAHRHDQLGKLTLGAPDGEGVQQCLSRVLVCSIAGVDHGTSHLLRQKRGRPRRLVPDDEDIRTHCVERHRRINQRFALFHR